MIENLSIVNAIVSIGYRKTGNKFSVEFAGSKGYLDHIMIYCEGMPMRTDHNIIRLDSNIRTKKGRLRSKMVEIYWSEENGVRVAI